MHGSEPPSGSKAPAGRFAGADAAFVPPRREIDGPLAALERRLLDALCARLPDWATPDRLTWFGVAGAAVTGLCYAATRLSPAFYALAALGVAMNWFGDSLDGSIARWRGIERPRYGFYFDHATDALSVTAIFVGLGLSSSVAPMAATLSLAGYLALMVHSVGYAAVSGRFVLTYAGAGPTEARIALAVAGLVMAVAPGASVSMGGVRIGVYTLGFALFGLALLAIYLRSVLAAARELG
ncbi:MAG: CDP-alcohol phosphatidyltransferase family protein [Hyphomicrobiales bacterium]|nr:CDP-alcohol phosphatidyltransferase family protein [Hyphomicrobiales bacterium]MDE2017188.1 CDP-alcohol phosphatidyltransferase family protein [Hyphomicrobiales bacterium]